MNPPPIQSQVKIDLNKNIFNKIRVKSNYTVVSETFGQWLIRQRRTLGLNQSEFAKRAGLTKATLSLYEKDSVAQPRFRQLDKIARALGKPPDEVRRMKVTTF
jgi:DNA-binding XRE family transcriptional regulator